jgi:hypothetical protein
LPPATQVISRTNWSRSLTLVTPLLHLQAHILVLKFLYPITPYNLLIPISFTMDSYFGLSTNLNHRMFSDAGSGGVYPMSDAVYATVNQLSDFSSGSGLECPPCMSEHNDDFQVSNASPQLGSTLNISSESRLNRAAPPVHCLRTGTRDPARSTCRPLRCSLTSTWTVLWAG